MKTAWASQKVFKVDFLKHKSSWSRWWLTVSSISRLCASSSPPSSSSSSPSSSTTTGSTGSFSWSSSSWTPSPFEQAPRETTLYTQKIIIMNPISIWTGTAENCPGLSTGCLESTWNTQKILETSNRIHNRKWNWIHLEMWKFSPLKVKVFGSFHL